jgi:rhodanese-related sulfurtransferase
MSNSLTAESTEAPRTNTQKRAQKETPAMLPETVSAGELQAARSRGETLRILDVRSAAEYADCHVAGTEPIPLDQLAAEQWVSANPNGVPVFVLCQSGGRARRAAAALRSAGLRNCAVVEGGLDAWIRAGLPVVRGTSKVLPLMRQVQLVVGIVSAAGAGLALGKNVWFALIPLGTGLGLTLAGATGLCPLASVLARMPWNRQPASPPQNSASCCARPE